MEVVAMNGNPALGMCAHEYTAVGEVHLLPYERKLAQGRECVKCHCRELVKWEEK